MTTTRRPMMEEVETVQDGQTVKADPDKKGLEYWPLLV